MTTPSYGCARCDKWAEDWQRLRAERDRLEATLDRVRELTQVYDDGRTVGLIRYAVVKQLRIALDGDA